MNWSDLPPLSALRAFAAFADKGSVQEAGDALNVSHAAISQQLRVLEKHLGVSLLDRNGRALRLTEEGEILAREAQTGFAGIAQTVASLTGVEAARPLRITTTTSFAANWLMPRLPEFRANFPDDDIVIEAHAERIDPSAGGVDLAIRYGAGDWPGFETVLLVASPVVGVATPDVMAKAKHDLSNVQWLQELGTHEGSEWLHRQGLKPKGGVLTAPGNLTLDAARAGQGVAITSRVAAEADLVAGRLQVVFEESLEKGYYTVTRPGVHRAPLKRFLQWLRRGAATSQGLSPS
ncbi:MAG: LysR substrate-binding domain-containing protein [Aliishimia sp.]